MIGLVKTLGRALAGRATRWLVALGGQPAKIRWLRRQGVRIGSGCRIYTDHFGSEPYLISIGDHCTVTSGVRLVTHDGACWVLRDEIPNLQDFGPIRIEDNCFIGVNAVILPGVRIGPNSIVAAGAVVNRDVPPGTVVGGVPARVLGSLEDYRRRKLERVADVDVPTDLRERRRFLEDKYRDWLSG